MTSCVLNPNGERTATLFSCLLSRGSVHTNRGTATRDAMLTVYSVRSTAAHAVTNSPTTLYASVLSVRAAAACGSGSSLLSDGRI